MRTERQPDDLQHSQLSQEKQAYKQAAASRTPFKRATAQRPHRPKIDRATSSFMISDVPP